ncbi:MAG: hypothetical protein ABI859_17590 [Pseudomonadota bacterium]
MTTLTPKQARDYLDRWKLVRGAENDALRTSSLEIRLRQLAVLMACRPFLGNDPNRDLRVQEVRERWERIRRSPHV